VVHVDHRYSSHYDLAAKGKQSNGVKSSSNVASQSAPKLSPTGVNNAIRECVRNYLSRAPAPWMAFAKLRLIVGDCTITDVKCSPQFKQHERAEFEAFMRAKQEA
jgi:hypothetical protein